MNSPRSHGTLEPLRSSYFLRCARRSFHREEFYSSRFFEVRRVSKMTRPSSGNAPSSAIEARGHCSGYCARGCIRNSRLRPLDVQTPDSDIFRCFVCAARRCRAVMSNKFDVVSAAAGFHLRSSAKYVTIHLFSSSRRASERETSAISPRRGGGGNPILLSPRCHKPSVHPCAPRLRFSPMVLDGIVARMEIFCFATLSNRRYLMVDRINAIESQTHRQEQ